jgi:hypothetical protein
VGPDAVDDPVMMVMVTMVMVVDVVESLLVIQRWMWWYSKDVDARKYVDG